MACHCTGCQRMTASAFSLSVEKLAWATTPAQHSFAELPELAAYAGLIAEYQSGGASSNG